jgi:chaperonin GroES
MAQDAFNGSEVMRDVFYPVFDRILVRRKESAERTASGLYIADVAKEAPQEGGVLAVGDDCKKVKQFDRILFGTHTGTEITLNGQKFLIMKEEQTLGILRKQTASQSATKRERD